MISIFTGMLVLMETPRLSLEEFFSIKNSKNIPQKSLISNL